MFFEIVKFSADCRIENHIHWSIHVYVHYNIVHNARICIYYNKK